MQEDRRECRPTSAALKSRSKVWSMRIEMLSQVVIVEAIVSTDDVDKIDGYRAIRQRC